MINQFIIVGRIQEIKNEYVIVSVARQFKDEEGNYINDILRVVIKGSMFKDVKEYCKVGNIIGVKGRIENTDKNMELIAEKITLLSSKKNK